MASSAIIASALSGALPGKTSTAVKVESLCLPLQSLYSHRKADKIDAQQLSCVNLLEPARKYIISTLGGIEESSKNISHLDMGQNRTRIKIVAL
jgi:hypothetical protein